tara:strand:+ start:6208 stop:7341 length:1134 start_codon:yes stop_codon:yes gene_type:complete
MGMIGNQLAAGQALTVANDSFNGDGSTTSFTLSQTVGSVHDIEVLVDNVQQSPYDGSYSVSGTTLTFSGAPDTGTNNIYVIYNASKHITTAQVIPDDGSVHSSKIASGAVTDAKIASGITATKVYPNGIRAGDLDRATQGNGLAGFEHIETRVCKSDGDTNFQTDLLEYTFDGAVIDLRNVRHLYAQYMIYYHLTPVYGGNDCNLLMDLMNYSSNMNSALQNSQWLGGNVLQDSTDGSQNGAVRASNDTAKIANAVWTSASSTNNFRGGITGKIEGYGFGPEVTNNIDGVSLKTYDAAMTNPGYRTYWEHTAMTYKMSNSRYTREIGFYRCNQTLTVGATSGDGSFGGLVLMWNQPTANFAKGSYWSVYGLRLPTGD